MEIRLGKRKSELSLGRVRGNVKLLRCMNALELRM